MTQDSDIEKQYLLLSRRYRNTIRLLSASYYPDGGYKYDALMCNLTTHLWEVYNKMPPEVGDEGEAAWVYAVLRNKARNYVRNEHLHENWEESRDVMPDIPDVETTNPLVKRLYELIDHLDKDDKDFLNLYLGKKKIKHIARLMGQSEQYVYRRLDEIKEKLRKLNMNEDI